MNFQHFFCRISQLKTKFISQAIVKRLQETLNLEAIEELEEFLQKLDETYGTRSPAAPEPKLCVPLTAHEEDSQKEYMQNQVMSLLTHNVDLCMF